MSYQRLYLEPPLRHKYITHKLPKSLKNNLNHNVLPGSAGDTACDVSKAMCRGLEQTVIYYLLSVNYQNPFFLMRHKRPFFTLEDDTPRFQRLQFMPYVLGDIYAVDAVFCAKHHRLYHRAVVIVCRRPYPSPKNDKRLILCRMPVDRHLRPGLYGIKHAMTFVLQRLVEIKVHTQARRFLRLRRHMVQ